MSYIQKLQFDLSECRQTAKSNGIRKKTHTHKTCRQINVFFFLLVFVQILNWKIFANISGSSHFVFGDKLYWIEVGCRDYLPNYWRKNSSVFFCCFFLRYHVNSFFLWHFCSYAGVCGTFRSRETLASLTNCLNSFVASISSIQFTDNCLIFTYLFYTFRFGANWSGIHSRNSDSMFNHIYCCLFCIIWLEQHLVEWATLLCNMQLSVWWNGIGTLMKKRKLMYNRIYCPTTLSVRRLPKCQKKPI